MWNIKFKGDRIIYEVPRLSLQEAISHYGGNDPIQASTAYLDRHYGLGEESRQLLTGYDCPYGSLTLDTSYHTEDKYLTTPSAICIFELDLGFPTSRHSDDRDNWYGSTRGTALTVRTMATVYNYDYMFDYMFYLEGTVEVRMAASGYLQGAYWDPSQNDYGTRIHRTTMGSIHTHVINWKIDLDVGGTSNSLQTNEAIIEEVTKPWFDEEEGPTLPTELRTNFGNNGQIVYLIANKDVTNKWGYPKAYRFQPGLHAIHNPLQGSRRMLNNARWSEWDLMVAKRKDTEPFSSTTWNQHLPVVPPVDFNEASLDTTHFFNPPENIDQEDLVLYANLGMHHIPRAEDTPNTLFPGTRSSFLLSPFNYYDEEPSRDIRNAILLQADEDGEYVMNEPGDKEATCALQALLAAQFVVLWTVEQVASAATCPVDGALSTTAPKTNIWAPLSRSDTQKVQDWVYGQKELNLTRMENATMSDNTLWLIESIMPNKTDALNYLDGEGKAPARYARVILYSGGLDIPLIQEYMVGPLPISSNTTYTPYSYVYQNSTAGVGASGAFPFNARYTASIEESKTFYPKPPQSMGPNSFDGNWRRYWIFFVGVGNGAQYLGPTGLFAYIDTTGTDISQWSLRKVVYNNQIFASASDFASAYNSGTLQRGVKPDLKNHDWSTRKKMGKARALDDRAAPRSVAFEGSRIKADKKRQYVEWMGWSFYLGFNRDTGLTMWNIKFKGDRIIYELALQEALAQYGGNDPIQASTAYLDRHYGIGEETRQLLSGYDCPYGALTLNASYHAEDEYFTSPGAICVFEADLGFPTSRHGDTYNNWYGSTRGTALTVRTMATVYNYDYMLDYIFYLEGTVEATYWDPLQDDYGTRIQKTTMGSVHTHVINYKVDLDIAGRSNSLQTNDIFVEEVTKPWFDDEDGPTRQLRINRTWVSSEFQTNFGSNGQTVYLIANKVVQNQWGYPKAYRFQHALHSVHNSARWSEWDLMIAKRKDTEPSSSTTWNQHLPIVPPVDFSKFFDPPENIDQQDLVIYANLGMHHIPRAEDSPNTLFTDTRSSFILSPFNYYDDEPSRDVRNAILLQANEGGKYAVDEPGDKEATCAPRAPSVVQYTGQTSLDV
ncbi:hypothetical protein FRC07_015107 [Ceratobasidium sp. 392]|nr:hypothetical protein FRC07_015107 [Ceratobasidium sp. 392]